MEQHGPAAGPLPFPGLLTRAMAAESLRCSPELGHIYLNNAKAGCSTIKQALWTQALERGLVAAPPDGRTLHGAGFWRTALGPPETVADRFFVFSFVRNPYARLLSAYRDKVARPGHLRTRFCLQYGLDPRVEVDFATFLRLVCATDPFDMDQHWRPQTLNLLTGYLPIAFVGHLESFNRDWAKVRARTGAAPLSPRLSHATGAADGLDEYDETGAALVRQAYAADFATFGYGTAPAHPDPIGPPVPLSEVSPVRAAILHSFYASDAEAALALAEAGMAREPTEAGRLHRLALRLRAGRPVRSELAAWQERLPDHELVLALRRLLAQREDRPGLARQLTKKLATLYPHRAAYRLERAGDLAEQQLFKAALREARIAQRLRPHHAPTAELVGRLAAAIPTPDLPGSRS